jgi:hypothetical protein
VEQAVQQVTENVLATKLGKVDTPTNGSKSASQPASDELPKLETGHKEPLKLSCALDTFESFDATPVIGREYANVDLIEWLRTPNSDELIRDLAITSKSRSLP